jgi:glycine dehydrogenase subunit 1
MAEGALIGISSQRKKNRIVVAGTVHPAYRDVLSTYVEGTGIEVVDAGMAGNRFVSSVDDLTPHFSDDLACVVIQYPNFFGAIEDVAVIADAVHAAGALLVVNTTPVPLGLLKSPGELGADVVSAEGQPLGVAQSYGGPYVGLLATRQKFVRQMPGRLAGVATDTEGKRGFVLTLQTREQHIRREKATSNICTNQGLMATAATVYMSSLGREGFREVANSSYQHAHYLAHRISAIPGYELAYETPFFHEFVVKTPKPANEVLDALLAQGILGGLDLGRFDAGLDHHILICATELNTRAGIDHLADALNKA